MSPTSLLLAPPVASARRPGTGVRPISTWREGEKSVYDRAASQAREELRVIKLELKRLTKRKKALEEILTALKDNQDAIMDTE